MHRSRPALPQLSGKLFLTDGGLETTLVFHDGLDLPCFAAFVLMDDEAGRARLRRYYELYAGMAREAGTGFVFEAPTWRSSPDWGAKLGYSRSALAEINRASIALMAEIRDRFAPAGIPMVLSGQIGPRGDGYSPDRLMSQDEAQAYHAWQIGVFAATDADMVTALTVNYIAEGVGIVRAAQEAGIPVALSFTLETDGRLPTGETLREAVETVDAGTDGSAAYFMLNCAHPDHFADVLEPGSAWTRRIRGLRANASTRSHAELDAAKDLDAGDPARLGRQYAELRRRFPHLNVLGGCCGTDDRHLDAIRHACIHAPRADRAPAPAPATQ